ncbi:MAG TPA: FliH/SctL family protein, partial [Ktedonobacterales bacterium]|nr:FliH/SctL family protein [Ktedonobacterales bacterium]
MTTGEWIQHGASRAQNGTDHLPQLWQLEEIASEGDASIAPTSIVPPVESFASQQKAEKGIAEAEARFAAELAAAHAEIERWRTHALTVEAEAKAQGFAAGHAEGFAQGRNEGTTAAHAEAQTSLDRLAALAERSVIDLRSSLGATRDLLAQLSVEVARTLVGEALRVDPSLLAHRIVALLERLSDVTTATVRLHPADLVLMQQHWPELAHAYGWGDQGPRLLGDDTISPGGCLIEAR